VSLYCHSTISQSLLYLVTILTVTVVNTIYFYIIQPRFSNFCSPVDIFLTSGLCNSLTLLGHRLLSWSNSLNCTLLSVCTCFCLLLLWFYARSCNNSSLQWHLLTLHCTTTYQDVSSCPFVHSHAFSAAYNRTSPYFISSISELHKPYYYRYYVLTRANSCFIVILVSFSLSSLASLCTFFSAARLSTTRPV